jgi:predicted  nucleic acid-binding Zn-ribbon protein
VFGVKADPKVQLRLLVLQGHDAALARLEHRRRTLPQLAAISTADARLAQLRDELVRAETEVGDLDRELRRLDGDVDQVRRRSERDQQRMQSGAVAAKELESLQHEVQSLARRQSDLEDVQLELMEKREDAESRAARVRGEVATVTAERQAAVEARDSAYAEIDADAAADAAARESLAIELPADLLALYDRLRENKGGVGAAALRARQCGGCRLTLDNAELAVIRSAPSDEVIRCEECQRILVRTHESGL